MFGTVYPTSLKPQALDTKAPVKPIRAREGLGVLTLPVHPFPLNPLLVCLYTVTVAVLLEGLLFQPRPLFLPHVFLYTPHPFCHSGCTFVRVCCVYVCVRVRVLRIEDFVCRC